ncbi:uncharacterized protein LOC119320068 [Triticum dicoccoides]|uniref:uncharacterized protein LOC119320068 n=1 Tax=Triticum dicoccoides TaxID=85692 RepID=UPI001890D6DD|nr:uncharacterized protein LOC119320068 [Triticum dicoccoides]
MSSWFLTSLFIKRILLLVRKSSRGIKLYSNLRGGWARLLTRSRLYRQRERRSRCRSRPWAQLGRAITSASDSNSSRIRGIVVVVAEGDGQELIAGTDDKNGEQDDCCIKTIVFVDGHLGSFSRRMRRGINYSEMIGSLQTVY